MDYDDDVIEAANLAIAIQKEDYTTNIELNLSCENLPRMDTFSQTDPMIVVYLDKEFIFFNCFSISFDFSFDSLIFHLIL